MSCLSSLAILNSFTANERIRNLFEQKRSSSTGDGSEHPEDNRGDRIQKQYKVLGRSMKSVDTVECMENEISQPRNLCPIWRSERDLPDAAKVLYGKAAELAGIPLATLIRGAAQVERRLELWCIQKAKEKSEGKDKGKGTAIEASDDSDY
jgi:RNA polymerase I-specific transcription initiation factor RRN7